MIDYVNHLARMHLLVDAAAGRANPAYEIHWRLYPNLAVDIIVPVFARFVGVETAARLFLLGSQILVACGAIALEMQVRGRHQLSGFVALIALYSLPFLWGLMNFEFGCGVALWGIVAWIYFREGPWLLRIALHASVVVVLFSAHLFALGIYGLTIVCYEGSRITSYRHAVRTLAVLALPVLAGCLVVLWSGDTLSNPGFSWSFGLKLMWPLFVMNCYSLPLSIGLALIIAVLLGYLGYSRVFGLTRPAVFIGSGFLVVYLLMPARILGGAYTDVRLITAMMLVLPAFLTVNWPSRAVKTVAALVAVGIILANVMSVASVWYSYRSDYADMIKSFALLRAGSTILIARGDVDEGQANAPMFYAPTLAVHYANAFVPSLYTISGQQPVKKSASKSLLEIGDALDYRPTPIAQLNSASAGGTVPAHVRGWRTDYDYLYIVGDQTGSIPEHLTFMMRSRRFALYAIDK
ncbi:hypothetical protein [Bradyrhizobium sp. DASA03120]|uniref:hypothetical protein n=1 Tax=Bradyrhizobium sp. SMVTL-02 TaxID=3395917 RepID=UPI003F703891